ncbi:hypothetical protein M885DRAFT_329182 [Pelagophyceae sp. CCMP2097]|nr:hypothetical protein M885DRAFT_329182 [Pelagophyceae sp. CCMP2097]
MRPRALAVLTSASSTARRLCSGGASADTSRILSSKTHFEVLSLPEEVNPESRVKRSFLELAQRVHPDKCHCPEAGKAFNRLKDAFAAIESQELQELQLANLQRERGRGGTASKINDTLEDFSQTRMIAMGVALLIAAVRRNGVPLASHGVRGTRRGADGRA